MVVLNDEMESFKGNPIYYQPTTLYEGFNLLLIYEYTTPSP